MERVPWPTDLCFFTMIFLLDSRGFKASIYSRSRQFFPNCNCNMLLYASSLC
ncbi:hypothetical protein HanRHA438_Chr08g0332521 [Helianthus annuus]|nr:hypothetical protein HanRHA438_Chr08g0332521 [Helianthus annuus]